MRISDVDFILVPEWRCGPTAIAPDDDHWISRWERNIVSAEWLEPDPAGAGAALGRQVRARSRPVIVVSHGRGVDVLLDPTARVALEAIKGAFIVAPAPGPELRCLFDDDNTEPPAGLPFPSVMIAPDNHPEFDAEAAAKLAERVGGHFIDAGPTGRIDQASGHGPWPEGLMRLGWFLKKLSAH